MRISARDVEARLGVDADDVAFLVQLGLLRGPRGGRFEAEEVERVARRLRDLPAFVAEQRRSLGAERIRPDEFVRPDALTIGLAGWGRLSWVGEVANPTIEEIRAEAEAQGIGETPAADALLVPPERRRPLNDAVLPEHLIHMAVFVGQVGAVWTVEKAIEAMLRRLVGAVRRASGRQRRWGRAKGFWFIVSIWYSSPGFWAVVAMDVPPDEIADAGDLVVRGQRRVLGSRGARQGAHGRALVVRASATRVGRRVREFTSLDEAVRHLGRVQVVSEGGALEVAYDTTHPRARTALQVCKLLQERPHRDVPLRFLELASGTSRTTVRRVLGRLAAIGAPVSTRRTREGPVARYDP